jgi:hypothetical protein
MLLILAPRMKYQWLRFALLLAFVCTSVGCGGLKPEPSSKRAQAAGRAPQTGTNIPRSLPGRDASARRQAKAKAPKAAKPQRERPAKREVDEDFVTRGGFR